MVDFGLDFDEFGVLAVLLHQFLMRSAFDHLAFFHHHETAGVAQGVRPVRDGKGGSVLDQARDGFLNLFFGFRVHAGRRFVQNEDFGVVQDGAGDRDALPFASRKPLPALADIGIVAVRELQNELVAVGGFGRAGITSSIVASGLAYAMLSRRVPGNRNGSCNTMPN